MKIHISHTTIATTDKQQDQNYIEAESKGITKECFLPAMHKIKHIGALKQLTLILMKFIT